MTSLTVKVYKGDMSGNVKEILTPAEASYLRFLILAEFNRACQNVFESIPEDINIRTNNKMLSHDEMASVKDGYGYRNALFQILDRLDGAPPKTSSESVIEIGGIRLTDHLAKVLRTAVAVVSTRRLPVPMGEYMTEGTSRTLLHAVYNKII